MVIYKCGKEKKKIKGESSRHFKGKRHTCKTVWVYNDTL